MVKNIRFLVVIVVCPAGEIFFATHETYALETSLKISLQSVEINTILFLRYG